MRLKTIKVKNFRGFKPETIIDIEDLSVFIGKNDAGKSTILEALEIFFNNSIVKIEKDDLNVRAKAGGENKIEISCIFSDLPAELVIDAANPTTLQAEYLVNTGGDLEIKKVYTCGAAAPKEEVFIVAHHPTCAHGNDLLLLKRNELRQRANELAVPAGNYNGNINSSLRSAIWAFLGNLALAQKEIQVDKEDAKKAWDYISKWMPQYALFKSDRESTDGDKEVTNPMKIAVSNAIAELQAELDIIQQRVMEKAVEVADRTLDKLREMNPTLANELTPEFKAEPKWAGLFSLTLASDNNIPINKRGSGVRRLIILNFFRAEAERRRSENNSHAIIYGFEEPENSQHPDHQELLIKAFRELSEADNTQVLITTHNPALAGLVNEDKLFFVTEDNGEVVVKSKHASILRDIADTLGMLPEPLKPRLLICVEGPNDVEFFKHISRTISQNRADLPDLGADTRTAIFPLGGGTLKDWVTHDYLKGLGTAQFHIYDLDDDANPPYQQQRDNVRARGGNNWAELTVKRETENYLHPDSINTIFGHQIVFGDMDDVPLMIAQAVHDAASPNPWASLSPEDQAKKASKAKRRLNREVASTMTFAQIQAADPNSNIIGWLELIRDRIN
ncbi:ATP-binding protein [Mucilaginibacter ginsenosidivorans]|uniref:ATP-binding protein n=1 Tax=Mucilaginibacter ginsenosidivorans TaxID=398053 RepID=A0A5B8USQ0_9SPHI|nr:ATP-binding protein [Mucilaginibacter ginsenosidivorans]QEC61735.1 ATP-binding protein [Mucilaginibacter ginsenosidivorans]